ncbi:MAG: sulfatase-like hydrolase/transferase [Gemmatimonadota bacterium]|nr:sulfatase-like hydrolase/transferase [Gemmatimonadota bacterium]
MDGTRVDGRPSARRIATFGLALGVCVGTTESAARVFQRFILDQRVWMPLDFIWMTPVAAILVFATATVLLLSVRAIGLRWSWRQVTAWYLFFAIAGPILAYPRLHFVPSAILAIGLAAQGGRVLDREWLRQLVRRAAPACAVLVALAAAAIAISRVTGERRALAAIGEAPADAPNVLLIILDTVRAQSMSLYGYGLPTTPALERLARESVVFDRALATSSWTLPSHGTLFTGRFDHEMDADLVTPLGPEHPTLAERLSAQGYETAGFTSNLLYTTWENGVDRGFARYEDYPLSLATTLRSSLISRLFVVNGRRLLGHHDVLGRKRAAEVGGSFQTWLDGRARAGREAPFFAFLNYYDAHAPYIVADSIAARFGPVRTDAPVQDPGEQEWSPSRIDAARAAYEGTLVELDRHLAALLEDLDRRGVLDNTVVAITSDHGEHFGEHGRLGHGRGLYIQTLHVPLLIRLPGASRGGTRVAEPVSLADLATTLEGLATRRRTLPGRSLARFWGAPAPTGRMTPLLAEIRPGIRPPPTSPLRFGAMVSIVDSGFHYIRRGDGAEEVFDFIADPTGTTDISATRADLVARLRDATARAVAEGSVEPPP